MSASGGPLELVTVVPVANPAAGADWQTILAASGVLAAIVGTFTASAAVANRLPAFQVQDGAGHTLWTIQTPSAQTAGQVHSYVSGPGVGVNAAGNTVTLPIPAGLVLPAGAVIKSATTAIDVADQWSAVVVTLVNR